MTDIVFWNLILKNVSDYSELSIHEEITDKSIKSSSPFFAAFKKIFKEAKDQLERVDDYQTENSHHCEK